jgi:aspartyl-tRNA(Asn)/glutamyl-tRNA(Gln) amidotransferase subunit C
MQHASSTLRKIFSETLRREGSAAAMLAWPLACGTKTADRTQAISFAEGILTIAVPDETWRRQLQSFAGQYLSQLNQMTSDVEPMAQVASRHGERTDEAARFGYAMRPDELRPCLPREDAMQNAPASDGTFFKVPKVIER